MDKVHEISETVGDITCNRIGEIEIIKYDICPHECIDHTEEESRE